MGYRRLLKHYLQHVEDLLGTTLVGLIRESSAYSKRDIGELKAIVAEFEREQASDRPLGTNDENNPHHGELLARLSRELDLDLKDMAQRTGYDVSQLTRWCYGSPELSDESIPDPSEIMSRNDLRQVLMKLLLSLSSDETADKTDIETANSEAAAGKVDAGQALHKRKDCASAPAVGQAAGLRRASQAQQKRK